MKRITIEEVKQAAREVRNFKKSYLLKKLNEYQRTIYGILERKTKMVSGALYRDYKSLCMKRLVELELVKVEGKGRWKIYEIVL